MANIIIIILSGIYCMIGKTLAKKIIHNLKFSKLCLLQSYFES